MEPQTLFGSRVRSLREAGGISRERAAEVAAINSNYLGEIERGEKWPSLEVLQRLAAAFNVSPATFFELDGEERDPSALRTKITKLLSNKNTEQLQQAMRVLNALFPI